MSRPRRRSDTEFRVGAVRIVKETGCPVAHVAKDFGVYERTLGNWVRRDQAERSIGLIAGPSMATRGPKAIMGAAMPPAARTCSLTHRS